MDAVLDAPAPLTEAEIATRDAILALGYSQETLDLFPPIMWDMFLTEALADDDPLNN